MAQKVCCDFCDNPIESGKPHWRLVATDATNVTAAVRQASLKVVADCCETCAPSAWKKPLNGNL